MTKEHSVGSIFIDKKFQTIYTIVGVSYWVNNPSVVFGYKIHRSDRNVVDSINDWWLDVYAEKVF